MDEGIMDEAVIDAFRDEFGGDIERLKAKRAELVEAMSDSRQVVNVSLGSGSSFTTEMQFPTSALLKIVQRLIRETDGRKSSDSQGSGTQFFNRPFST